MQLARADISTRKIEFKIAEKAKRMLQTTKMAATWRKTAALRKSLDEKVRRKITGKKVRKGKELLCPAAN